jgi:hypothetical protein
VGKLCPRKPSTDLVTEYPQAKLPDGHAEMGPTPVILLALEGKEDILPLQEEFFTNLNNVASFTYSVTNPITMGSVIQHSPYHYN